MFFGNGRPFMLWKYRKYLKCTAGNFVRSVITCNIMPLRMESTTVVSVVKKILDDVYSGAERGTTASREARCRHFCDYYSCLDGEDKITFLKRLTVDYSVDHESVRNNAKFLVDSEHSDSAVLYRLEEKLRLSLMPKYTAIFHEIARFEGGVKFLVDMRTDVLDLLSSMEMGNDLLHHAKALNSTLQNLLALWFSVGFMQLQRITWESACDMLQKVSDYEAVHPVRNWTDLKRRVGSYRRCFAFTHKSMPGEPIVVLHTALMDSITNSIQSIVAYQKQHSEGDVLISKRKTVQEDPSKVKAAIFYSITSTQRGLIGIELGNYLIKQVVREVQTEFPLLNQYSSLSPIPGFKEWLLSEISKVERGNTDAIWLDAITEQEKQDIMKHINSSPQVFWSDLKKLISKNWWINDVLLQYLIESPLMKMCSYYLYVEKRRGFALNSVANFHLKNGAVMWRLNWKGDLSPRGLTNSCGMMVNYRYYLNETEKNTEIYLKEKFINASEHVTNLVKPFVDRRPPSQSS